MLNRRISPHRSELLAEHAAAMRHAGTPSEQALWRELSGSKLGVSFKRQVPLGGRAIVDFLASRARLIVEVDGKCHARRSAADARRDRGLRALGYRVLRLEADLVLKDLPTAVALVRQALIPPE